jgi:hypothetical protein
VSDESAFFRPTPWIATRPTDAEIPGDHDPHNEAPADYFDCAGSPDPGTVKDSELSPERCNVGGDIFSVAPTHRKIHLRMRADECSHEIILAKSIFSANYLKRRRVCDDAPRTSTNDVTCRASILSYVPPTLNIPSERRSGHQQRRDASSKTKRITLHNVLRS